ncbi:uncharacterized protein LOC132680596 [Panthera onca]
MPLTPARAGTFDALAHISSAPLTHSSDGRALRAGSPVDSVPLTLYVCHESLCVSASRSLLKPWVPGSVWELKQAPKTIPVHGQQEPDGALLREAKSISGRTGTIFEEPVYLFISQDVIRQVLQNPSNSSFLPRGAGPGGRRVARGARRRGRAASPRARAELQRDGARTEAPRPAEGAAAPRRRGCGLRGAGPGGGARAPACASRGGREGVRASAAPRRPPARARSPPRGLSPPTAPRERGARVARRAPSLGLRRRPPRRPSLSGRRGRRSGGRGGARPGALSTGPGGLGAAGAGRGAAAAAAAWAVPARGECGGAEPALPAGVGGRRGDGGGERAAGAGASLAAPPPLASPGKFVGVPASGISVAGQRSTRPSVNRELELEEEEEEEEEDAEEARPHPVRDASLVEGSGGFWDIFLGPFPPRFPHLDRQLRELVTNGSKTRFLEVKNRVSPCKEHTIWHRGLPAAVAHTS